MPEVTHVEVVNRPLWERWIFRFRDAKGRYTVAADYAIDHLLDDMQEQAQHFLDVLVYDAPLPKSAERDPNYLMTRRTRRTRNAVKKEKIGPAVGKVFVDRSDYPKFFYALTLEFGMETHRAYYPRPFWRSAVAMMGVKLRERGIEANLLLLESFKRD